MTETCWLKELAREPVDSTSSTPLYRQIADTIREKIISGRLKEGANLAPEYEIAEGFGVSLITTRKAFNLLVQEGLIYRRPKLGTFVGRRKNRPVAGANILFLLCNHRMPDQCYSWLFNSVEEHCREKGFSLNVAQISDEDMTKDPPLTIPAACGGMIVAGSISARICSGLRKTGLPFVVAGELREPWTGAASLRQIVSPVQEYGRIAAHYLIARGHRNLVLISGNRQRPYYRRIAEGFLSALRQHRLPTGKDTLVCPASFEDRDTVGYELAGRIRVIRPTAVVCSNDALALGVMRRIIEDGLRIPDDISVVGIGNLPSSSFTSPALTSLDTGIAGMGKKAVEFLIDIMEGRAVEKKIIWNKMQLVERASVREEAL